MTPEPILPRVHVITPPLGALVTALGETVRRIVTLVPCERTPHPSSISTHDLVIVDLTVSHNPPPPRTVTSLLDHVEVWLVVGGMPVDPGWVDRARHPRVRVISINTVIGDQAYKALITALLERYAGPLYEIDAERLLELEPALRPVAPYVRLVCGHPWLVRRPRDLADLAHCSLRTLKLHCLAIGFTRVEHFILYVRAIAYEQLIARGLHARDARRLSGFTDPSNMRRHVRRALRRSPHALKVCFLG